MVRQRGNGDTMVDARPRIIKCSPSLCSVQVCSPHINMGVQVGIRRHIRVDGN
ncbi:hypothetical protein KIN20_013231 [Parelaphostrongylus tenuis]|uniref:Uncharacterized protein n=1 Tax=Parelaphostrongylus tenuis TaxID=148309 RepID=A0AAD5QMG7_PARTN|nr:hypothetical protein KIN20_013231 [Parelaphostrongylus tenuis]